MIHLAGLAILVALEFFIYTVIAEAAKEITYDYLRSKVIENFPKVTEAMLKEALLQMERISYDQKTGVIKIRTT